ncbi:uncharacterized protein LOC119557062 [Drosophila subpulchrella]|uniref:uncharacterized protein LOC119557062 n=1 Tax=Drosophila subpulchrella TaxID=1486046 RepID=UPI0018A13423|nr:uncharacterized protein LOC119557062 [Drosophila subpulchrella]
MRKMQILIQTRDGRKSIYEVDRFGTVGHLKERIGRTMCVPMGFSRLTHKGRILANQSILEDVGVKRMSTLDLYWQPVVLTPKQLSEKEGDLDKLEQKKNNVQSGMVEGYDQMVKTGGMMKASSIFLDNDAAGQADSSNSLILDDDDDDLDDQGLITPSSDALDFLGASISPIKSEDLEEHMPMDLLPMVLPPDPLVQQKVPETSAPTKHSNHKKKGKKNRKKK